MSETTTYYFPHEQLDCYQLALELKNQLKDIRFEMDEDEKQAKRAIRSVLRNIAEGVNRIKGNRKNLLRAAHASAAEVASCLDCGEAENIDDMKHDLRRVGQMVEGLIKATK